jgi:drug/metabolite transporter (DMT)-like permease
MRAKFVEAAPMPLWLSITLGAALCQNIRTTLQHKIRGLLSVDGANFVRYLYGAPLALLFVSALTSGPERALPTLSLTFLALVTIAGLAQIVATSLMIHSFALSNYAAGTVYSKTETLFVALFATFVTGEKLSATAWTGVVVCLLGVVLLSARGQASLSSLLRGFMHKGALFGVGSGVCFALASICIREASKQLPDGDYLVRGMTVLACMNTLQVLMLGAWLGWRDKPQLTKVAEHWRSSIWVGLFSALGSSGWVLAVTLENAARVRAAGQIELVFTVVASRLVLKEQLAIREWCGCAVLTAGVLLILAAP